MRENAEKGIVGAAWGHLLLPSMISLSSPWQIIQRITWVNPPTITLEWKRKVAQEAIDSLSASKLAKSICSQFRTRLNSSHEAFAASLRQVRMWEGAKAGTVRKEPPLEKNSALSAVLTVSKK